MGRICAAVFWIYLAAAALALVVAPVSVFGLFGVRPSPFGAIFAVLLAQPWFSLVAELGPDTFASGFALICVCIALNAAVLRSICWLVRGGWRRSP